MRLPPLTPITHQIVVNRIILLLPFPNSRFAFHYVKTLYYKKVMFWSQSSTIDSGTCKVICHLPMSLCSLGQMIWLYFTKATNWKHFDYMGYAWIISDNFYLIIGYGLNILPFADTTMIVQTRLTLSYNLIQLAHTLLRNRLWYWGSKKWCIMPQIISLLFCAAAFFIHTEICSLL